MSERDSISFEVTFRSKPDTKDIERIRKILEETGFFYSFEIEVAIELIKENLENGERSGYHFVFADINGDTAGFACYGPIPCSTHSWDFYWIAVKPDFQNRGIGKMLLKEVEGRVHTNGGKQIYVETSSRAQYLPTRLFYESCGYRQVAFLNDFYGPGDSKVIFEKVL